MDGPQTDDAGAAAPAGPEDAGPIPADENPDIPRRQRVIPLAIAGALLVSLVAGIVVFARGGNGGSEALGSAAGMVVDADEEVIVVDLDEPLNGEQRIEFAVPAVDRSGTLDIDHLLVHSERNWPVRIEYERRGETYIARGAYDLPALP